MTVQRPVAAAPPAPLPPSAPQPSAGPSAAAGVPAPRLLQLLVLLAAAVQVAMAALSTLLERGSGGRLHPPRALVAAPAAAVRAALLALLFASDCWAGLLVLLQECGSR